MSDIIYLQNVRLSFPHLTEPHASAQGAVPKYSADFIMGADHPGYQQFATRYAELAAAEWKEHAQQVMGMIQQDRKLRNFGAGEEKVNKQTFQPYDGYAGQVWIMANNKNLPQMIKTDGNPIDAGNTMEAQAIARTMYGGCYVNAAVKPWVQDNQFGKGIRCDLVAVQFHADGEAFGEGSPDASGMFGAVAAAPAGQAAPVAAAPEVPAFMQG